MQTTAKPQKKFQWWKWVLLVWCLGSAAVSSYVIFLLIGHGIPSSELLASNPGIVEYILKKIATFLLSVFFCYLLFSQYGSVYGPEKTNRVIIKSIIGVAIFVLWIHFS